MAVDPSGNIWVADSGHNRVLEFNPEREYLRQFGTEGSREGQFKGIQGIATDASGDVYVTDSGRRVQEFSPTGTFLRQFGSPGSGNGQFSYPTGIALDASGNVWVLDTSNSRVQEFSPTGAYLGQFGSKGTGNGQLGVGLWRSPSPAGTCMSPKAQTRGCRSSRPQAHTSQQFGSAEPATASSDYPRGIASDPTTGNLYVSDIGNNRMQEFSPAGSFIAAFGSGGSGAGQLSSPRGWPSAPPATSTSPTPRTTGSRNGWRRKSGEPPTYATSFTPENIEGSFKEPNAVAIDPSGNIWVADSGHYRVLEFNPERKYLRQFGTEGTGEGQFKGIRGIATDASGDVYVTDSARRACRSSRPTGTFLRQFGSPGSGNGQFSYPTGIALDASGNVWVLDIFNSRVQEFSPTGAYLGQFGSKGTGNGQLGSAFGLAFSGGNLYVSEGSNQRVQEFSTAGTYLGAVRLERDSGNGQFRLPAGHRLRPDHGQPLRL